MPILQFKPRTVSAADGSERNINVRNEWGGFSRSLQMPVFTGWQDRARMVNGQMRVLVANRNWTNTAGVNNQEHGVAMDSHRMPERRQLP